MVFFLRLFFLSVFFLSCFLVFSFSKVHHLELKIDPSIQKSISEKGIQKKIEKQIQNYKGIPIWKVDLKKIVSDIKKIYNVGNIYSVRRLPNKIIIFLEQDHPIALILKDEKDFFALSYEGDIRYKMNYKQSLDFPILRGKALWKSKNLRKKALEFLSFLPQKGEIIANNISEIKYNKKNNSFLLYLMPNDFIVEWQGDLNLKKVQNINFVLSYMSNENSYKYRLDARFDKKIIVNKIK